MFTAYIYSEYLARADEFWLWYHHAILWGLGLFLDLLLVALLAFAAIAVSGMISGFGPRSLRLIERTRRALARADSAVTFLAGAALVILVSVTFFSVIGRKIYQPIPDDLSFAEWSMVAAIALMLAAVQGRGEHIEVTILSNVLDRRANQVLRLLGLLVGLFIVGRMMLVNIEQVPDSFLGITYGSIYELPLWPPQLVFFVGIAWWLFRIAMQTVLMPAIALSAAHAERGEDWDLTPLLPAESGSETEETSYLAEEDPRGS